MKLSDKYILSLIKRIGPKSEVELYHIVKKSYEHIDKLNLKRRLKRLHKNKKIFSNNKGKIQAKTKIIRKNKDKKSENDFYEICEKYNYQTNFKNKLLKEIKDIPLQINKRNIDERTDLRKQNCITIDGADAKDLDDAVYLTKSQKHYRLFIHIADVSHYVKEKSKIDREALKRGNSVYLIDKVIPMLPPILSNNICSLKAKEDRLSMSVEILLDKKGNIRKYDFHKAIINVEKRFTYDEVEDILQNKEITKENKPFVKQIKLMETLARALYKKRLKEGSLFFKLSELYIKCDEKSNPIQIKQRKELTSHKIIEEFMLSANKVVALFLKKEKLSVYRIHKEPDTEKINTFIKLLHKLGHNIKTKNTEINQQTLQKILDKFERKKEAKLVNIMLLKSMQQASYSIENNGHFALGFPDYTHFTSPIRRYSDLIVHRILKQKLKILEVRISKQKLIQITQHISETERTAILAEREIIKKKSARFMKDKIGKTFDGVISSVTDFGLFVEIMPYGIEGLIRLVDLDGYYILNADSYSIERKDKKIKYTLGNPIKVRLINVNVKRTFIDLIPTMS